MIVQEPLKKNPIHFLAKNKKGSLLWELLLVLAILFIVLYSVISFIGVFIQYENLTYAAKTAARQIEVTGQYGSVQSDVEALTANSHLKNISADVTYIGPVTDPNTSEALKGSLLAQQKLQLRQQFTITVTAVYEMEILGTNGDLFSSFTWPIQMSYEVSGMSEVFWRS